MSFSSNIKEKLAAVKGECEKCDAFFLAGFIGTAAKISKDGIAFSTEHEKTAEKAAELVNRLYGAGVKPVFEKNKYIVEIHDNAMAGKMLNDTGYLDKMPPIGSECCVGAFARGAFLGGGSITDPQKSYHLEFVYKLSAEAQKLEAMLLDIGIDIKRTERKNHTVLYVKEYEAIAGVLGLMGAGGAAIEIFNISTEKELRNRINRQMNCEAANMDKIVTAYGRHLQAITKLQKSGAFSKLPEHLKETAELRVQYPEDSLNDLGKRFKKPIGKSGVNHRLNKLIELAENL